MVDGEKERDAERASVRTTSAVKIGVRLERGTSLQGRLPQLGNHGGGSTESAK